MTILMVSCSGTTVGSGDDGRFRQKEAQREAAAEAVAENSDAFFKSKTSEASSNFVLPVAPKGVCAVNGVDIWGRVYVQDSPIGSTFTIFVQNSPILADFNVYLASSPIGSTRCGLWYLTSSRIGADFSVYISNSPILADFTVYLLSSPIGAGR